MLTESSKTLVKGLFNNIELNEIVEFDGCLILEEITSNIEKHLKQESGNTDATDGIFDAITELGEMVIGEFEDLLEGDDDKKRFLKSLSKIFGLLLNTKVSTADKTKKMIRLAIETTLKYGQDKSNLKNLKHCCLKINCRLFMTE